MPTSGGDGFGREEGSFGISDDRQSREPASFYADGRMVGQAPRKLKQGDVITVIVDISEEVCIIAVNDFEFSVTFHQNVGEETPSERSSEAGTHLRIKKAGPKADNQHWFGATFANDHRLTIVSDKAILKGNRSWKGLSVAFDDSLGRGFSGSSAFDTAREELARRSWLYRLQQEAQYLQTLVIKEWLGSNGGVIMPFDSESDEPGQAGSEGLHQKPVYLRITCPRRAQRKGCATCGLSPLSCAKVW